MKITEQQSNDHNPTMPPIPMLTIAPSVDSARENQTQAENEVEVLTPIAHTISTKDHYSEQSEGSPQVEAISTAMAIAIGGMNPQEQPPRKAVTVAPLQWIITTPEYYGLCDGHDEGLSDSGSDSAPGSSDAGDEEQSDSVFDDGDDDEQPDSDSGDDDDDDDEEGQSDSGDTGGDGESDSDSGDADDERESDSDSGDGDDEDEDQSDSDSDDDCEEEENEEEEAEEEEEDMDVDDEIDANPPDVHTDDGGNNSLNSPASVEIAHRDTECSDRGTPDLTSGSSEEDSDVSDNRGPVTATSLGLENGDGESSDRVEIADGVSVLMTTIQRRARTSASNASDQGNANSSQIQRATPMDPEQAAEENGGAVSSDNASEGGAPASSQVDEDMKSDSEEDEVSGTLRLRGGAGEPEMEAYLDEEETELTGSEGPLEEFLGSQQVEETTNRQRETQESDVTPTQDMEEAASEPEMEGSHGEEEIELTGSDRLLLPSETPESPMRPGPRSQRNEDSENSANEQGETQGQAVSPDQDSEGTANQSDAMIYDRQDDTNLDAPEILETPLRGRYSEDPTDVDRDRGEAVSSPEIGTSRYPSHQRSEVNSEDTQEPAGPSEQDVDDDTSEPAVPSEQDSDDDTSEPDWDDYCLEARRFQHREQIPESPTTR